MSTFFPLAQPAFLSTSPVRFAAGWEIYVRPRGIDDEEVAVYAVGEDGADVLAQPLTTGRGGRIGEGNSFGWVKQPDLPVDLWGRPAGSADEWQVLPEGDQAVLPDSVVSGSVPVALGWSSIVTGATAVKDAEIASGSKAIKSPGGHFKPAMNGQFFYLLHGGPVLVTGVDAWVPHPLVGTFTYVSATEGTLSVATSTTVTAGEVIIGPDFTAAIQEAIDLGLGFIPANVDLIIAGEPSVGSNQSLVGSGRTSRVFSVTKKANMITSAWTEKPRLENFDLYGNGWGAQPANVDPGEGVAPGWANSGCGAIFAHVKRGVIKNVVPHFCGGNATTSERNGIAGIYLTMGCEECDVDIPAALYNRNGINEDNYFSSLEHEYAPLNNSIRCLAADYNYIGVGLDSGPLSRGAHVYAIARHNVIYGVEGHRTNFCTLRGKAEYNGRESGAPGWILHGDEGSEAEYRGQTVEIDSYFNGGHGGKVSDHIADFRVSLGINSRNQFNGLYIANKCKRGKVDRTLCRDNGLGGEFHGVSIATNCSDIEVLVDAFDDQGGPTQTWGVFADSTCERITVDDGSYFAGNIKGPIRLEGVGGRVGARNRESILAAGEGFKGQAFSRNVNGGNVLLATKKGRGTLVGLRGGEKITSLYAQVDVVGAGLTRAELAICKADGTVLARTANIAASMEALGVKGAALETALVVPEDGVYYIVVFAVGTTPPSVMVGTTGTTGYTAQVLGAAPPPSAVENTERETLAFGSRAGTGTAPWFGWA